MTHKTHKIRTGFSCPWEEQVLIWEAIAQIYASRGLYGVKEKDPRYSSHPMFRGVVNGLTHKLVWNDHTISPPWGDQGPIKMEYYVDKTPRPHKVSWSQHGVCASIKDKNAPTTFEWLSNETLKSLEFWKPPEGHPIMILFPLTENTRLLFKSSIGIQDFWDYYEGADENIRKILVRDWLNIAQRNKT